MILTQRVVSKPVNTIRDGKKLVKPLVDLSNDVAIISEKIAIVR